VSLSFGIQGLLLNPNKDNAYTFRFTLDSLAKTIPFYSSRFLILPFSGLVLFALAFIRDRRIWFGLAAMSLFAAPLLFLPARLYEAYIYLPFAFAAIALAGAATRVNPACTWIALAIWMSFNVRPLRHEQRQKLALDDQAFAYVSELIAWSSRNPGTTALIYDGLPDKFHVWGLMGAWEIAHHTPAQLPVWPADSAEGQKALATQTVAVAVWDRGKQRLRITAGANRQ